MIRNAEKLMGRPLQAKDGEIGKTQDLLFDDQDWQVRYVVADARELFGRQVLLSHELLGTPDAEKGAIPVDLTCEKIRNSPQIDTDRPVGREQESAVRGYYGLAPYWGMAGNVATSGLYPADSAFARTGGKPQATGPEGDRHLRSVREVAGYAVTAKDGSVGEIDGLLVDVETWRVRYLIVDTRRWEPGRKVALSPHWAADIDWTGRTLHVELDRQTIRDAPEYRPGAFLERGFEEQLHAHYGYPPYWVIEQNLR